MNTIANKVKNAKVKKEIGHAGARTQDLGVISTALYRLSYATTIYSIWPKLCYMNSQIGPKNCKMGL